MFYSHQPSENDLPSSSQLIKSTIIAFVVATFLLVLIILPAEYGVDPTGVGHALGLKKMGDIKTSLKQEAINDIIISEAILEEQNEPAINLIESHDRMAVQIQPDEAIEIKLEMKKGTVTKYKWTTENGTLNYNLHGDGYKGTQKSTTYKKGRNTHSDKGELIAEFDGYHGWFWRNRNDVTVTVKLEASGDYIQMKQMK